MAESDNIVSKAEMAEMAEVFGLISDQLPNFEEKKENPSTPIQISDAREQLAILVSTGRTKEAIGVNMTHDQVLNLSEKDVKKYAKRYEAYIGSKTTDSLIQSFLCLSVKAAGSVVKLNDVDQLQKELKDNYVINKELAALSGKMSLKLGPLVAVANAALITAKYVDFSAKKGETNVEDERKAIYE